MLLIASLLGVSFQTAAFIASIIGSTALVVSVLTGLGIGSGLIAAVLAYPKWYTKTQLIVW